MKNFKLLLLSFMIMCSPSLKADIAGMNLLTNPSFDNDLSGWSLWGGSAWSIHGLIYGQNGSPSYEASQGFDLFNLGVNLSAVDAGFVDYSAVAGQSAWNTVSDTGMIMVRSYNEQGYVLGDLFSPQATYLNYTQVDLTATLLSGTRYLRMYLFGFNQDGGLIDSYFEDASFELNLNSSAPLNMTSLSVNNVPEPYVLGFITLLGIGLLRRNNQTPS